MPSEAIRGGPSIMIAGLGHPVLARQQHTCHDENSNYHPRKAGRPAMNTPGSNTAGTGTAGTGSGSMVDFARDIGEMAAMASNGGISPRRDPRNGPGVQFLQALQ